MTLGCHAESNTQHTVIKYYNQGFTPQLVAYLEETLKAALDQTVSKSGTYELKPYMHKLSASRAKRITEKGQHLHLLFATHWHGQFINNSQVKKIDLSIFNGMLGLRGLIASSPTHQQLNKITVANELRQYTAGLGEKWGDVEILKSNRIPVIEIPAQEDGLFSMLAKKRYDYLPLSMLEANEEVARRRGKFGGLSLNDNLYIFYPIPVDLYIHKDQEQLFKRLSEGYKIANEKQIIHKIFHKHFAYLFKALGDRTNKLVLLTNPLYSEEANAIYINAFQKQFGKHFQALPL